MLCQLLCRHKCRHRVIMVTVGAVILVAAANHCEDGGVNEVLKLSIYM